MTEVQALVDPQGRTVRDLRISVTDRCNFRCTDCMPEEDMTWLPRDEILSFEEIERVARVCVERWGFTGIRLTGGEPTVRAHLPVLVERLARLGTDLAMTTNGASLPLLAADLKAAGLKRLTVSLDTLDAERFAELTARARLDAVLEGITAAQGAGFTGIKINVVLMRGINDDEVETLAAFGRDNQLEVRFIEFMPLDGKHEWGQQRVVPATEIIDRLDAAYGLEPPAPRGGAPATTYSYKDGRGRVGIIPSVTQPFCDDCDRMRLTADGMVRACLFAHREADLRPILRGGGSDDDLAAAIAAEIGTKWAGHSIGQVAFLQPRRTMSQIGG